MCGIAGKVSPTNAGTPDLVDRMCAAQVHRGPDSRGLYQGDGAVLGIQRLRVVDLVTGDQPIYSEDRKVVVVLNGEIYNFRELRRELESRGHAFASAGDTEVLVHLYEEFGPSFVERLDGMFAFALWDERKRRLLLGRDRVGKKPLFYAERNGQLSFASELGALMVDRSIPRDLDHQALRDYLFLGVVPHPSSIWRAVRKLPPASLMVWEAGRSNITKYWNLDFVPKKERSVLDLKAETRALVAMSVRKRMISDVPLGALLSGGVDSAIVVSEMSKASAEPIATFTIGFENRVYDERDLARLTANHFGTRHHEFVVTPNAVQALPRLVRHYGEPFADSSALPSFYLSELTGQHVTVALNGDGGDEGFGGYLRYVAMARTAPLDRLPDRMRRLLISSTDRLPASSGTRTPWGYARRLLDSLHDSAPRRYAQYLSLPGHDGLLTENLLSETHHPARWVEESWNGPPTLSHLDAAVRADIHRYLPDDLLVKMDIAAMAHSLEARSPLLDHHLLEFAATLPSRYKVRRFRRKYLLREAYRDHIPREVLEARKRGFGVPLAEWFRGDLGGYAKEILLDPSTLSRGYFSERGVSDLLATHANGHRDVSAEIWALLFFEHWHRAWVDV